MKACRQRDPTIKVIFYGGGTVRALQWKEEDSSSLFFSLIWMKLGGRNCETINCAFFIRVAQSEGGSVAARLHCLPQSFALLFRAFCLSHFSINLHDLTPFIKPVHVCSKEQIKWSLSLSLPLSPPHTGNLFFFPRLLLSLWLPSLFGCGVLSAQDAELHGALQGFRRHEAVCVRLKSENLWCAGRAL